VARNESVEVVRNLAGLDLLSDASQMEPNRFRRLKNFYPPRGKLRTLAKRLGSAKYNATAIPSASAIDNMLRAWSSDGVKALLVAATLGANDEIHIGDDTAGTFAQVTGGSALPAGKRWFFKNWPLLGKAYAACGDGTVPIQIIATPFTTKADMTIGAGATDARFGQFLEVFFSSLISARTPSNPNYIYYFNVALDDTIGATQFWRIAEPVTALAKNTYGSESNSLREQLLAWGAGSMWVVSGDPASATIEEVGRVGNLSPKATVSTPFGTIFLGVEPGGLRNVFMVDADPHLPRRIGNRIIPALAQIPAAQLKNATATFHDGFYKLSVASAGGATNTEQYWADFMPMLLNSPGEEAVPEWFGPMMNLALKSFVVFDGPEDAGELRGGDNAAGTVWKLNEDDSYADGGTLIDGEAHTKEFDEGDPLREKVWNGFTFGFLQQDTGVLSLLAVVDGGRTQAAKTLTWESSGALWDSAEWDTDLWGGEAFTEAAVNLDTRLVGRNCQLQLRHALEADFQLRDFGRKARIIRRML